MVPTPLDDAPVAAGTGQLVDAWLVEAIRIAPEQPIAAADLIDSVAGRSHRIGGSIAQRDLITITRNALTQSTKETP
jgi:hypothetical protein